MADVIPVKKVPGGLAEFGAADKVPAENLPATEWAAETVSQAEAEAGTATDRRAWTAQRVAQAVRGAVLTGLSTASAAAVTATDSVLSAMGKLQAQITGLSTSKLDANANAVSATKLQNARTINGVAFDGTANINVADSTLDSLIDFTIIYPNGGSAGSPANVAINTRYVETNPFPGHRVLCQPEILVSGQWCGVDFSGYTSTNSTGVGARQHNDGSIVVQTGVNSLLIAAKVSMFTGATRSLITAPTPCRVKVWKVKGAIA